MITKEELITLPKGQKYIIEWDRSKIVEILIRKKFVGVWGFYIYNIITKQTHLLKKGYNEYYFTIKTGDEMIKLGQLLPKITFPKEKEKKHGI